MARKGPSPDRASQLLAWYDAHARVLPWRSPPGAVAEPYRVWLSEIMLQQTTVQAVKAYFEKFVMVWPRVEALAAAPLDDVLALAKSVADATPHPQQLRDDPEKRRDVNMQSSALLASINAMLDD